jgi:hypothetical protein
VSLNDLLSALGPLGVARGGPVLGDGLAGVGEAVSVGLGVAWEVGLEVVQPATRSPATKIRVSERMSGKSI